MDNRLFVGNLSFQTNADSVRHVFEEFGAVEDVHLVTDRETGRSRGFAFVTMSTGEEAQKAIAEMNGQNLDGRPLRVNLAEERPRRSGPGGGGGGYGGRGGGGGSVVVVAATATAAAAVAVVVRGGRGGGRESRRPLVRRRPGTRRGPGSLRRGGLPAAPSSFSGRARPGPRSRCRARR